MRLAIVVPVAALLGASFSPSAALLSAQTRGVDFTYGRWWHNDPAVTYTISLRRPFFGPFDYGLGLTHLDDSRSSIDRTQTGGELSLGLGRGRRGLYLVASTGLAMRHEDRNIDAHWSAGAGFGIRLLSFLGLAVEGRYRVEDRSVRGFWRLDPADRRGFALLGRVAIGGAGPKRPRRGSPGGPVYTAPADAEIRTAAVRYDVSGESAELAAKVVKTALEEMGTPYRWGGSDENGFDCSGLIQYAYQEHGILLPRVSRDQARIGLLVERSVAALRPGDILGFSLEGPGVSHVGLYVGDGMFIHSASSGVKLSNLTARDPDSRWWQQRWVAARRILN